jgi:ribonuclease HII
MIKAVNTLNAYFDKVLLDGNIKFTQQNYTSLIKGDTYIAEIAASSIIAKVARDNFMVQLAKMHPLYAWEKNKGYGTKIHIEAIKTFGLSNYHRKSFCKNYVDVS